MDTEGSLKIISITGAHSRVGKTTLCSLLLKELKGFGAIKFTKTTFYTSLVNDPEMLGQKGKDTAIMSESGAERVLWVLSPRQRLKEVLKIAMSKMSGLKGVIIEGNSPVDFLNPHLVIFIIGQEGYIKPSALKVSKRADILVINSKKRVKKLSLFTPILGDNTKVFWIDLIKKKGEINEFLSFVKERIIKGSH
jgi:molybdopterin-guanine dinucleotide biosynthesis protein